MQWNGRANRNARTPERSNQATRGRGRAALAARAIPTPLRQVACCGRHCARSAGMLLAACRVTGTVKVGETVAAIVEAHRSGATSPEATIARTYARIRAHGDPAVFISLRDESDARRRSQGHGGAASRTTLPLYGVPFAVKDNIDVKGLPTTAACPAFAYDPGKDATCVARLQAGRRHRHRQDQSRPVRHRTRRRAHALRHAAQPVRPGAHSGRIELGLGDRGRRPASFRSRSAPTPPDRVACRRD